MQYPDHRQEGAALIIGLLLLLLMTIIGATAINITTTETKVMANARDKQVSFMAAEAALAHSEDFLDDPAEPPSCNRPAGYLDDSQEADYWWQTFDWSKDTGGVEITGLGSEIAQYVIEPPESGAAPYKVRNIEAGAPRYDYYRVTSHGKGPGRSETYLQGVFVLERRANTGC